MDTITAKSKVKKIPVAQMYLAITKAINVIGPQSLPEFEKKFYVVCDENGSRLILQEFDGEVVKYVNDDVLMSAILKYCHGKIADRGDYHTFDERKAKGCAEFWRLYSSPIDEPAIMRQKSEPGKCFRRLPWDFETGETPLFDEFLSRCSDPSAVKSFIGSLFDEKSDRQQYLFLHGDGMNGKGTLIRLLGKIFAGAFASVEPPPEHGNQFWNWQLVGKRLVAFPDCNDRKWITSQKFKMLTGGDYVSCERKQKDAATYLLKCKFIFCSNTKPDISGQKSDMRRIIFCKVSPIPGEANAHYEEDLWLEAAKIVGNCIEEYKTKNQSGYIRSDTSEVEKLIDENEETLQAIFDLNFELETDGNLCENEKMSVSPKNLYEIFAQNKNEKLLPEFKKFISRKFGIISKPVKYKDGLVKKMYVGMQVLPHHIR
jgi:hypothetical protein